jgi:hypothetical protein
MYTKKVLAIILAVALVFALAVPMAGAADYTKPAELADFAPPGGGTADVTWPLAANTYDPGMDAAGIPNGAYLYCAFTMDASYVATPLTVPASIAGYTKVEKLADLKASTWVLFDVNGYNYIALLPGTSEPDTQPIDAPTAPTETPADVAPAPMPAVDPVELPAIPTNNALSLNGQAVPVVAAYKINGENYFKLRDVANIVTTFNIGYDNATKVVTITPSETYVPDGSESKTAPTADNTAIVSNNAVVFDGKEVADLTVYKIDGSNYFRLRDFDEKLGLFTVGYDDATKTATITAEGAPEIAVPETPAAPETTETPAAKSAKDVLEALKEGDALPTEVVVDGKTVAIAWYSEGQPYSGTLKTLVCGYFADADTAAKVGFPAGTSADYITWTPKGWADVTTPFAGFLPDGYQSAIIWTK